jgi:hypothetical protein
MLDVHSPHEPILNWKDFTVHLLTITIGLLIALSLEGMVEWFHHRHLVHEAEASLHAEIAANASDLKSGLDQLHAQQKDLSHDVDVLKQIMAKGKVPPGDHMSIGFHILTFKNLGWKTAEATGAAAYMPYDRAQEYAAIYTTQDELADTEKQAARDAILSLAPFVGSSDSDPDLTPAQAEAIKDKIQILVGQTYLVDSLMQSLDKDYKKFLAMHPEN